MEWREIAQCFDVYRHLFSKPEWHAMIDAFARPLPATMWIHPTRVKPRWIAEQFSEDQHQLDPLPYTPGGFKFSRPMKWGRRFEFRAGLIHLQEAASMLPPLALRPQPGDLVLDMCAAPGGKSAQLSLMMKNQGTLIVNDLSYNRLRALRATQERLGLKNMVLCAEEGQNLLKDHPPCFDKVLVDAPCSCEGTLRKRGKWSYETDDTDFKARLVATQKALLLQALKLTKAGGRVVYSTCTLDPDENEGVIDAVFNQWLALKSAGQAHCELVIEELEFSGLKSSSGLCSWEGAQWTKELKKALRVYPHQNDSGGFFLASIKLLPLNTQPKRVDLSRWTQPIRCTESKVKTIQEWAYTRFGLDQSIWRDVVFTKANSRYISSINRELLLPPTHYQVAGLPSIYIRGAVPRFTSAGALEWGSMATQSIVELSRAEVDQYYAGESQVLNVKLPKGVCIPCHQGYPLGLAYISGRSEAYQTLKSEYPKRLRLASGHSAFETAQQAERT